MIATERSDLSLPSGVSRRRLGRTSPLRGLLYGTTVLNPDLKWSTVIPYKKVAGACALIIFKKARLERYLYFLISGPLLYRWDDSGPCSFCVL